MGSVEVHILGQKYTVRGDADEEYIQKLAAYVDTELKDVYSNTPNITPLKAAILAALNIADKLHKLQNTQDDIAKNIEEQTNALSGLFD